MWERGGGGGAPAGDGPEQLADFANPPFISVNPGLGGAADKTASDGTTLGPCPLNAPPPFSNPPSYHHYYHLPSGRNVFPASSVNRQSIKALLS